MIAPVDILTEAREAGLRPPPERVSLTRGATLVQESPEHWLYQLRAGRLRLSRLTLGGRKLDLETVVAPSFLFGAQLDRGSAEAMEECRVVVLTRSQFETLVERPALRPLAAQMVETLGRRLAQSEERLEYLAYHSVPERLALALMRLRSEENGIIDDVTHQELADMVGACRETVTKALNALQDRGHILIAHRRIKVSNPTALSAMLDV